MTQSVGTLAARVLGPAAVLVAGLAGPGSAASFTLSSTTLAFGSDHITHAAGYDGTGGARTVTVGIRPGSPFITEMMVSVGNVIRTWNGLVPTIGNVVTGLVPNNLYDFESVLLHEVGHALGLDHVSLATDSISLGDPARLVPDAPNYSRSIEGPNGVFDLNPGPDGIAGSADDLRGDDISATWFNRATNDPFSLDLPARVDSTTYSRDPGDLPLGDSFAANANRAVANAMGYANTAAVMVYDVVPGEALRTLAADDVAGIRLARSGVDMLQGTADDYTSELVYAGVTESADITIGFNYDDDPLLALVSVAGYLTDEYSSLSLPPAPVIHSVQERGRIAFEASPAGAAGWEFNTVSNAPQVVPLPAPLALLAMGLAALGATGRRRRG